MSERKCKFLSPAPDSPCRYYIDGDLNEPGFCKKSSIFRCIEALKSYLPHLTQSALKSFIQCKYKYYLSYILGIQVFDHHLPLLVKLGAIWDKFVDAKVSGKPFKRSTFSELIDRYQIYDTDASRLTALFKAAKEIGINFGEGAPQQKIVHPIAEYCVVGYVDCASSDHFKEVKLTGSPDFFNKAWNIQIQIGTYFFGNPEWEYVDLLLTRRPAQKTGKRQYSDESPEAFSERIYHDIIKRPAYYFIGYNRDEKTFGKRFWRTEFDLENVQKTYHMIFHELHDTVQANRWVQNSMSCLVPTACWYLPICETGVVSDKIYYTMDKKEASEGMK